MPLIVPGITQQPTNSTKKQDNKPSAAAQAFHEATQANPGPVVPKDVSTLGEKATREDMERRVKELNNKE
jgi:thiamine pyrophosphate-dependent acetolactate synthase large subunit-like protein